MTPPVKLPPGHYIGDGHNHGGEGGGDHHAPTLPPGHYVGDGHNHGGSVAGHDHGHDHEGVDGHSHAEEENPTGARPRDEFQGASRQSALPRPGSNAEQARNSERNSQAETRPETQALTFAQASEGHENPELARFLAAPNQASSFLPRAMQGLLAPRTSQPSSPMAERAAGAPLPEALVKLQRALEMALSETGSKFNSGQIPPPLSEALTGLLQEALQNPQILPSLPPALRQLLQAMSGSLGKETRVLTNLFLTQEGVEAKECLLGLPSLARFFGLATGPPGSPSHETVLRGFETLFSAWGTPPPFPNAKLHPTPLQRLERALMQVLSLIFPRKGTAEDLKEVDRETWALQQLATLVAAKEKEKRDRQGALRSKKGERLGDQVVSKQNSDFSDGESRDSREDAEADA